MFSVLACVAFAFSGFASNEVVSEENSVLTNNQDFQVSKNQKFAEACYITITTTNKDGSTRVKEYYVSSSPFKTCEEAVTDMNKKLNGVTGKQSNGLSKN